MWFGFTKAEWIPHVRMYILTESPLYLPPPSLTVNGPLHLLHMVDGAESIHGGRVGGRCYCEDARVHPSRCGAWPITFLCTVAYTVYVVLFQFTDDSTC